jgi:hypothetical protein
MISTRDLTRLPGINELKRLSQSLAMLDAILSPEWESRYYPFNSQWGAGAEMASMRNGSGDEYFLCFNAAGAILKGFAHESPMTPCRHSPPKLWAGLLESVPKEFATFLVEPAFDMEFTTFCIWRRYEDRSWQCGRIEFPELEDPDGSAELLALLDGKPATYRDWAEQYYEIQLPLQAVREIYEHHPLTPELLGRLNPEISLSELQSDREEIGWAGTSG